MHDIKIFFLYFSVLLLRGVLHTQAHAATHTLCQFRNKSLPFTDDWWPWADISYSISNLDGKTQYADITEGMLLLEQSPPLLSSLCAMPGIFSLFSEFILLEKATTNKRYQQVTPTCIHTHHSKHTDTSDVLRQPAVTLSMCFFSHINLLTSLHRCCHGDVYY